jgi:DNA mismatch repair ATPase MutL
VKPWPLSQPLHVELKLNLQAKNLVLVLIKIERVVRLFHKILFLLVEGTSLAVKKNLFYNIPARRNFLKSDTVERAIL